MQIMRCLCSAMQQWQLGAWARGQSGVRQRGQSSTARAGVWCVFRSAFPGVPLPPSPRGSGKTGRLSGDGPCATTHSLLRLPAKHRPARCYSQVTRKLLASFKFIESSSHYVFTSFQRNSIHYLGDLHLVFTTFELYYK